MTFGTIEHQLPIRILPLEVKIMLKNTDINTNDAHSTKTKIDEKATQPSSKPHNNQKCLVL